MPVYHSLTELVGRTPLLELSRFGKESGCGGRVLAKLEFFNPCGSTKDRAALAMVRGAEARGQLHPGDRIVEPTSGNTGVGLALAAACCGYRLILTMPESMSAERRSLLRMLGAELVLTPAGEGMSGAVQKAKEIAAETGAFLPDQFQNPDNPAAHRASTAPEILEDTGGQLDFFVAGVGTGGTITGVGSVLKEKVPGVQIVAVEPADSPLLSEGRAGPHALQGIGANFVPENLDRALLDEILPVSAQDAYAAARLAARTEGLLVGISSGAALHAAATLARRPENAGKTVVALLPDTGERYLSTPLYTEL